MFWGFIGLSVTTTLDYIFNRPGNYVPLFGSNLSVIRLLGNVSGVVMMAGATIALVRMIAIPKYRENRNFGDVWFTTLLFLAGLTGFIAEYYGEVAHAANPNVAAAAAYSISFSASATIVIPYGIHLVSIGLLFLTAPVSFFMHVLQVPSMRYMDRVGELMSVKDKREKNELRSSKESAMMDQIEGIYEKPPSPIVTSKAKEEEKKGKE